MDERLIGTRVCTRCEHHADVCECKGESTIVLWEEYAEKKYHKYHTGRPEECYQRFIKR